MNIKKFTRPARRLLPLRYCGAVIVAAGNATRMGGIDKAMTELAGMPVLQRSVKAFQDCDAIREIVVVTRQDLLVQVMGLCKDYDKVKAVLKKYFALFAAAFVLCGAADAFLTYRAQVHGVSFAFIETVHIIYCTSAIFFFLGLFLFFKDRELPRILSLADRSSYLIYLCHVLFIYMANAFAGRIGISGMAEKLLFRFVFAFVATLVFSMGYTALTEKIKNGKQIKSTLS